MLRVQKREKHVEIIPMTQSFYVTFGVSYLKVLVRNKARHPAGYKQSIESLISEFSECRRNFDSVKTRKNFSVFYQFLIYLNENDEKTTLKVLKEFILMKRFLKAVSYFVRILMCSMFPDDSEMFMAKERSFNMRETYLQALATTLKIHISISEDNFLKAFYCNKASALLVFFYWNERGFCIPRNMKKFQMYYTHTSSTCAESRKIIEILTSPSRSSQSKMVGIQKALAIDEQLKNYGITGFIQETLQDWTGIPEWFQCSVCKLYKQELLFKICQNSCVSCHSCSQEEKCSYCNESY
jgi:hypothetical protein